MPDPFVPAYVLKSNADVVECSARTADMNACTESPVEGCDTELGCVGVVRGVLDEEVMRVRHAYGDDHKDAVKHFCERLAFTQREIDLGQKHSKTYRVVLVFYTHRAGVPDELAHAVLYPSDLYVQHPALAVLTAGAPVLGYLGVCCGRVQAPAAKKKRRRDDDSSCWETISVDDMLACVPDRAWDDAGAHRHLFGPKLEGTPLGRVLREAFAVCHADARAVPAIVHGGSAKDKAWK